MKTTLLARLSALTLSFTFAAVATVGVAFTMTDSGERAHLAAMQSAPVAMTQSQSAPTL